MTPLQATLSLLRNPDTTLEALQEHFGKSEAYIAGLLDAVNGDDNLPDDGPCSDAECHDYQAGLDHGVGLCGEEVEADRITAGTSVKCSCCGAVTDVWASYPNMDLCLSCEAVNEPAEPGDDPTTPAEAA